MPVADPSEGDVPADVAPPPRTGLASVLSRARRERTLRREADMMGFTVCIALLAALAVGNDTAPHSRLDVLAIVWGTTVGLALTHWFALILSVRLVKDPTFTYTPLEMLYAQTAMAVLVATTASAIVLMVSTDFDRLGARVTAAVFLAALVGVESRAGGSSMKRATLMASAALVAGMTIATAKRFFLS